MTAEPCPAELPMCVCGARGCKEHNTTWLTADINWRKARKKRKRGR
jgi:hypothetical protein